MFRAIAMLLLGAAVFAQTAAPPRFEVASIKATAPEMYNGSSGCPSGHGRLTCNHVTLKRCIIGAYMVGPSQIIGGPPWLDTDRFEIAAKAEDAVGDGTLMEMLQTLLAERFKLAMHRETRMLDSLVLEVAKGGAKLEKTEGGDSSTNASTSNGQASIKAGALTMDYFAFVLSRTLNVPVVNQTGLSGVFNFKLQWSPESDRPVKPGETPPDNGPSIYTAIQQQLGLRLQSRKAPVEVLVIDHAEKPTEN